MKNDQSYFIDSYAKNIRSYDAESAIEGIAQKADCPFVNASADDGTYLLSKTKDAFSMDATAKEGKAIEALAAIYREGSARTSIRPLLLVSLLV